jgi:hypothetical protein
MRIQKTPEVCKQHGTYDCMLACIAMVVQRPYAELWPEEIRAECEQKKGVYGERVERCFQHAGLARNVDYWLVPVPDFVVQSWFLRNIIKGRRALLQVPSLNHESTQHMVYWDGARIYDPSNKQVYRWLDQCAPNNLWIFNQS